MLRKAHVKQRTVTHYWPHCYKVLDNAAGGTDGWSGWLVPTRGVRDEPPTKVMGMSKPSQSGYVGCHHQHRVWAVPSKASRDIQWLEHEAISEATNSRYPPSPKVVTLDGDMQEALASVSIGLVGPAATQHSLQGPSSRSSVEMPEQGHLHRGNIQVVTIDSGSFQGIRRGRRHRRPTRHGKDQRQLAQPRSNFQLTWRSLANDP